MIISLQLSNNKMCMWTAATYVCHDLIPEKTAVLIKYLKESSQSYKRKKKEIYK